MRTQGRPSVEILSLATANPGQRLSQSDAARHAKRLFPHLDRFAGVYEHAGIEGRYFCQPIDWYYEPHGWEERTQVFQHHALSLLENVALRSVAAAGLELSDIDMIVTNTITGLAIPSLDAMLMDRLDFSPSAERLPIFGLGCGGGVAGLSRAARLAQARPGANVLFMTVDLCSLCLRSNDPSVTMYVSTALFGDGAAGMVMSANGHSEACGPVGPVVVASGEHLWRKTQHIMGWDIKGDGFGVVLSPELPKLMKEQLGPALDSFLAHNGLKLGDFEGFLLHPGGRKVLETAERVLGAGHEKLAHSWSVLRDFGNMSSVTALFVLERAWAARVKGRHLMAAFGPGFSAYFAVVDF
jgi:alkylresorcinol/alkylpyrone synthase